MAINDGTIINHLVSARVGVQGEGNLKLNANSYRQVRTRAMTPIAMTDPMDKYGNSLSNFSSQRIQIEIYTDGHGEWFKFSQIIAFIKPMSTSYPNG